jgi:hypothetical protein
MYYIYNIKRLGENKIITYCNKFINDRIFGCKYSNQEEVNKLAPNVEDIIPQYFLDLLNSEIL